MKKNTEWEVLTPLGWKDFDGVSKTEVPMDRVVVVELVDGTSLTCSAGHQVTLKRYDEVSHVFVELIEPEYGEDAILTKNGFVKVKSVTKHVEEKTVDMYDLVNVDGGYEYYTNDIVSHNCAHIDDMAEIWVGIQPTLSCVTGDTLVLTNNGFQKIEDFHANKQVGDYFDLEIPIYGKNGMEKTSHGYVSPNSETVIIQTSHGHKVEVTPIHPLYVLQDTGIGKMVQAQNLKLDSYLRIEVGQNIFGNENLDPDVAYMLGGYIAEGWIAKRRNTSGDWKYDSIEVENTDSGFRDVYLSNSLVKPFSVVPSRTTRLRCSSRELISKWIEYGIDPHACCYNKQTPRAVLEGTKSTVVNYLSGLFDGDGSVTTSGIVYSTTSEKLARETSLLLHNLGFVINVHHVSPRTSELGRIMPQGKPLQSLRDSWRVIVMRSQFEKFANEIGFRINRKQKLLLKLATEFDQNSRKLLTVPASLVESSLCSLLERSGKSQRWFRGHYNIRFDKALAKDNHKRVVTQEWLIRTKKAFSDLLTLSKKDLEFYSETIGSFYWDKIHSLAESCNKTYDFTVPETHTFLQNGILGSNTGGQAILISCVTKDTMVYTSEGIKTLEHFSKQTNGKQGAHILNEYTVQGIDKTRNGTLFFDGGNVPTKIIKTSFSEIECSHEHKFWAWSQEKGFAIHKAHEITKHDTWLAIRKNMNIWNKTGHIINDYPNSKPDGRPEKNIYPDTNSISLQMAYFLGLYYAEGSIYKSQDKNGKHIGSNVHICCGDTEAKEELEKLGLHVSTTGIQHTISSKSLVRFMEYLGVDPSQKADSKVLPDRLMSLPVEHTVALLQGLFDGDGYSRIDRGEVGYTSISEKLVDQIRILLCNLGILTYKTKRTKEEVNQSIATDKQFKHDSYILSCSAIYSNIFFEKIGFRFKRKQQKNTALFTRNLTRMSSKDLFPPGYVEHAKKVVRTTSNNKTMNKDRVAIQSLYGTNVQWLRAGEYKTPSVSRESMLIVNKYLEQNCQTRLFDKQVLDDDIVWAPVKSIEESHGHVYDFSLPNNKADGDFAHSVIYNSGISGFQSPNGVGNTFHRIWVDAIEEKNDFVAVELPWTVHPERDQAWYEKESNNIRAGNGERGVQQEFHCVPGETKVVTLDGCKNIKDISVGDKVLTHQGRFRKVYATHKHSYDPTSESLYTVSAPGNRRQSLLITGNHPVLNYKFKLRKHQSAKEMLLANKASFDGFDVLDLWKHEGVNHTRKIIYNALFPQCSIGSLLEENKEHILLSDFCTGANLQVSEEGHCRVHRQNKNKTSPIENQQTLSFDFGRFVGLFAAEGFSAEKNFGFAFHLDEKDTLVSFVESFLKNFGACYYTKIRDYSKCITVCSTNKIMKSVLEQFVKQESGATTKHYNMDALLKTNPEFIRGVVVGHFEGDGDHPKNGLNRKLKVSCYSPKMLYQLKVLLSCYGLFGRIGNWYDSIAYYELDGLDNLEQQNRNIDFLTRQSNTHKLLEKPNSRTVLFEQERQFVGKVQFSKASQELQAGMKSEALELYNISVEEDESYIADSIVVHNCSFNASGDTFVKSEILGIIEENCSEPIAKHNKWPELWIWKHPEPGHNYLISADVSRGNSADFSACQVFNTTTDEIVAEYKGKIYPDKFAELLIEVGTRYNTALICPELNTYGAHTATELKKANYGNLYYEKMHKNIYMAFSNIEVSDDELPGWTSGPKSRDEIIAKLEAVLRKQTIRLPSKRLVNELKTFIWKNNKAQAMKGYNDDLVMALAIGVNLYETSGRPQYSHEEIAKGMLAGMSTRGSQMNAGLSDWGVTEVQGSPVPGQVAKNNPWLKVQKPNPFQKNPKSVQNHNDPFWRQWGWLND